MSAPIEQSIYLKNTNIIVNITLSGFQTVTFDPVTGQDLDHQPPAELAFPPPNFNHVVFREIGFEEAPNNGPDFVKALMSNLEELQFEPVIIQDMNMNQHYKFYQQLAQPAMPVMPVMPVMPAFPLPDPNLQDEVVRRPQPKKFPRASKAARSQAWKAMLRKFEISHMRRMALRRYHGYSSRFQKPYKPRRQSPTPTAAMPVSAIGTVQNPIDLTMEEE